MQTDCRLFWGLNEWTKSKKRKKIEIWCPFSNPVGHLVNKEIEIEFQTCSAHNLVTHLCRLAQKDFAPLGSTSHSRRC